MICNDGTVAVVERRWSSSTFSGLCATPLLRPPRQGRSLGADGRTTAVTQTVSVAFLSRPTLADSVSVLPLGLSLCSALEGEPKATVENRSYRVSTLLRTVPTCFCSAPALVRSYNLTGLVGPRSCRPGQGTHGCQLRPGECPARGKVVLRSQPTRGPMIDRHRVESTEHARTARHGKGPGPWRTGRPGPRTRDQGCAGLGPVGLGWHGDTQRWQTNLARDGNDANAQQNCLHC